MVEALRGQSRCAYDAARERIEVVYDAALAPGSALRGIDNIVVSKSRDLYVAEDGDDMQLFIITPDRIVTPFLELVGHDGTDITGPTFNPTGIGSTSARQRGQGNGGIGMTFEVRGPFRS